MVSLAGTCNLSFATVIGVTQIREVFHLAAKKIALKNVTVIFLDDAGVIDSVYAC